MKILDFGLAQGVGPGGDRPRAASDTSSRTPPGMVLGTVGYMSPEQVRGQPLDHRTDIFSFGAILYEMLTGRRAFRGDSHGRDDERDPEGGSAGVRRDQPALPGSLERIVRRCLEKQPTDRFHSAHDLAISLEHCPARRIRARRRGRWGLIAPPRRKIPVAAVAAALLAVGAAATWPADSSRSPRLGRLRTFIG